ncbi:MAG: hypothetical protein GF350_08025, partial [Chitinivibrionales bacterium]|nr:hypothetical protein [Chitinivibrionales bacterium]
MKRSHFLFLFLCCPVLFLTCESPKAPDEQHRNAQIDVGNSLVSLPDSIPTGNSYSCTLSVILPDLVDSFFVRRVYNDTDIAIIANGTVTDSHIAFSLSLNQSGEYGLDIVIVKGDNSRDSASFAVYGYGSDVAGFDQDGFLRSLPDSVPVSETNYSCTALVSFPDLIDSFAVVQIHNREYETVLAAGEVSGTNIVFTSVMPLPGQYRHVVYISIPMQNNDSTWTLWDTLSKTVVAYSTNSPEITSFVPAGDSLALFSQYSCTLEVTWPGLVDSFSAVLSFNEARTRIAGGKIQDTP